METKFTKDQIINIGNKLAKAGLITGYAPRSHSHNIKSLFPQTSAQYDWLKRTNGTTANLIILHTEEEVKELCPEIAEYLTTTNSGRFCRICIVL